MAAVLEARNIYKSFRSVQVLKGVSFSIAPGEIHALVGENGAGKSTIIKIISGVYTKDGGQVLLDGQVREFTGPKDAMDAGIRVIHQEINMVQTLTVAENIFLGSYHAGRRGLISWDRMNAEARKVMDILGDPLDVTTRVSQISIAEQQMIEIAKALSVEPKVLIMDEPTAALNDQETEHLFQLLERLKEKGTSIIYITHRFSEIYRLADRATVLRDGISVGTLDRADINDDTLVRMMAGENNNAKYVKRAAKRGEEIFRVEGLCVPGKLEDIHLSIRRGELTVIFGLVGAGQTELCRALFGDLPHTAGHIWLDGKEIDVRNILDAIRAGIGYVSDDRKAEGLIPLLSVQENICIPSYPEKLSNRVGILDWTAVKTLAKVYYDKLHIKAAGLCQQIGSLSGGNQQKAMICRWLAHDVKLLILNMPTRGVDVGARAEIYRTLDDLVSQGVAVLAVSPEMQEVLAIADTVYVMCDGRITSKVDGKDATQDKLLRLALDIDKEGA